MELHYALHGFDWKFCAFPSPTSFPIAAPFGVGLVCPTVSDARNEKQISNQKSSAIKKYAQHEHCAINKKSSGRRFSEWSRRARAGEMNWRLKTKRLLAFIFAPFHYRSHFTFVMRIVRFPFFVSIQSIRRFLSDSLSSSPTIHFFIAILVIIGAIFCSLRHCPRRPFIIVFESSSPALFFALLF